MFKGVREHLPRRGGIENYILEKHLSLTDYEVAISYRKSSLGTVVVNSWEIVSKDTSH